jgi:hypothetical protein
MSIAAAVPAPSASSQRLTVFAVLAIFLASLAPVLSVPVFPMVDFYDHLSRYFVLSRLPGDSFLSQNYQAAWAVLPNIGLDVLGVGLMRLFSPLASAHFIVVAIFTTQYFGVLFFNCQLTGRISLLTAILAAPLLYSFIFTWGFANFLLGLGLVFWAAGAWIALRRRPLIACAVGVAFGVLIFLTHGVAFALYGLLVGALEVGLLWSEGRFRIRNLLRSAALLGAQAVLPVILFVLSPTSKVAGGASNAGETVKRLAGNGLLMQHLHDLALYRLATIYRVAESPSAWVDALSFVAVASLLLFMGWRRQAWIAKPARLAIALGVALVALTPPTLFGVAYVADRMPLFLAFTAAGAIQTRERKFERPEILGVSILLGLMVLRLIFIEVNWQRYRTDFADFRRASEAMPTRSLVVYVSAAREQRMEARARCEMYGPLLIALRGEAAPLFAVESQQPIRLRGSLSAAEAEQPKPTGTQSLAFQSDRLASALAAKRFDYVLVCDAERLPRPVPATSVVAHVGRFTVLKTAAASR